MPLVSITSKAGRIVDMDSKATNAYDASIQILKKVIGILAAPLSAPHTQIMNKYFLLGADNVAVPPHLTAILANTLRGLEERDISVEISMFNSTKYGETRISLAKAQLNNENQAIRYLIHEATHAFARTNDYADRGYINNDGEFRQPGLNSEEAILNADSYACFVVGCVGMPFV
jgi:hypothetical protein